MTSHMYWLLAVAAAAAVIVFLLYVQAGPIEFADLTI